MRPDDHLIPDDFRMPKEQAILLGSFSFTAILTLFVMGLSPIIPLIIVVYSSVWIKIKQTQLLGNSIQVTENNFPDVYKASKIAAQRLSMNIPDVFVKYDPYLNAFAIGFFGKKSVVLHSKLISSMDSNELISVIGHEFSHIKCGHTSWLVITNSAKTVGIPVISKVFEFIFLFWSRSAEYTSDRGGLIACRNLKASTLALMKLAAGEKLGPGVDIDEFLRQIDKKGGTTKWVEVLAEALLTHPYAINRIKKLSDFYSSDTFKNICQNQFVREDTTVKTRVDEILKFVKTNIKSKDLKSNIQKLSKKLSKKLSDFFASSQKETPDDNNDDEIKTPTRPDPDNKKDNSTSQNGGAKPPIVDNNKLLIISVLKGQLDVVNTLLTQKTADPGSKDKDGNTSLHFAVILGNYDMVRVLLDHGACIDQPNNKGETPLSIAEKNNLVKIVSMLKKYNRHIEDDEG